MDKYLRIALIVGILTTSTSLAYYYTIFLPKNEQAKTETRKQERASTVIEEKKQEVQLPKQTKTTNRQYNAPKISKDTNLEIEKCKTKLTEGFDLTEITNVINQIFVPKFQALKQRTQEGVSLLMECLKGENGQSDEGRKLCQMIIDTTNDERETLEKERMAGLQELIKNQQRQNYQNCLNSI